MNSNLKEVLDAVPRLPERIKKSLLPSSDKLKPHSWPGLVDAGWLPPVALFGASYLVRGLIARPRPPLVPKNLR